MPERVPIPYKLATKMRVLRRASGLSQAALATRVGVPRARIKRLECRELGSLDAVEYQKLAVALGITKRKAKKKAPKAGKQIARAVRIKAARAVLEDNGLLDVTLGELLRVV